MNFFEKMLQFPSSPQSSDLGVWNLYYVASKQLIDLQIT